MTHVSACGYTVNDYNFCFQSSAKRPLGVSLSKPVPWGSGQKKSKSIITPFSKKDLFYGGSIQKLMKDNETMSTWDEYRHLLLSTPK